MGRELNPKLEKIIDARLAKNGAAQEAIKTGDARALTLYAAQCLVGEKETSFNRGPIIDLIHDSTGEIGETHAWCARFVHACIAYTEKKTGKISPVYPSGSVWRMWTKTPKKQRVKNWPLPGAIICWQNGDGNSQGTQGHTGFVISADKDTMNMVTVEGNTGPESIINGEGDGVFIKHRKVEFHNGKVSKTKKILGFIKPF